MAFSSNDCGYGAEGHLQPKSTFCSIPLQPPINGAFTAKLYQKCSTKMTNSSSAERLPAVDLARGIALLGVALVNVHAFAAVWSTVYGLDLAKNSADVIAEYAIAVLFTHRSYPVLVFLFGVGLTWQWQHLPEYARKPNQLRPRLWALLLIGVAHGLLLWPGEVLTVYALMGLVLVSILRFSDRVILGVAIAVYLGTALLYSSLGASWLALGSAPTPVVEPTASFALSSLRSALQSHRQEFLDRGLMQVLVPDFWAHALLGIWAGRSGALQRFLLDPFGHRGVVIVGALLFSFGTTLEIMAARYGGWDALVTQDTGIALMTLALLWASLGGLWLWLTISGVWAQRGDSGLKNLIVAAGRAPLTQFIGQSIVFAVLFNKSLVGLYGELGRGGYSLIAIATYGLLCAFIRAWLASGHAHGPMEVVWRRLTGLTSQQRTL